ncbi:deoxyguanosine kinase [Halolactibacillus halophilus]|uniref:Deoxyguanosine kinase n=1 Tax=Halolactibacillus halophilus TaxID=306540 RepID=A0A1I5S0P3_9BACI|nr:deoxynucleoside kinase [Halolactibacillus halophilus]GEM02432.1 deoxyguanosine kinase [Halolactibacillus halophilus]SFP64214.1 deoxyguanosine kinase [Halolactibacillus halophilus]
MTHVPFIAVEGPIGVGKTSLSKKIAAHFDLYLLKEIVEENPFLGKFYDDIDAWSFQTEMFFLCNRFKQLEDTEKDFLNQKKPVVSDYHIMKNMIFAKRTLKNHQLDKYEQIYQILTKDMPLPNVMIYLDASLDTLLERIELRNRQVEENIKASYLSQLRQDYQDFMDHFEKNHPEIPVIRINGDDIDFIKHQRDLETIFDHLEPYLTK